MKSHDIADTAFDLLTGDDGRDDDLPDCAQEAEHGNFLRHMGALSLSKIADGLLDPKLVLSFLLSALGAPAALIGMLVPVREAGALLPQLFTASRIRAMTRRKWAWTLGAAGQAMGAGVIVFAALTLSGLAAGVAIVAALGLVAVSRSVCSVAYKDVLGKTVGKPRRGTVTGSAGSIASVIVALFAVLLIANLIPRQDLVIGAVAAAATCFALAAVIFAGLREPAQPAEGDHVGLSQLSLLGADGDLRRFVVVRCLLLPTALAPPYLVVLSARAGEDVFQGLGVMMLATALAGVSSAYIWGRLSDRSSRLVLALAGGAAAVFLILAIALDLAGLSATQWAIPLCLFGVMIAYQGVRNSRSTYLVNLAPEDQRASYTAVANTVVGAVLIAMGGIGALSGLIGVTGILGVFAALSIAGAAIGFTLKEV